MLLSSRTFSSFCVCTLSIDSAPPISTMKCRSLLFSFSLCSCPSGSPCGELLPVLFQSLNTTGLSQKLCHVSTINKYLFLKLMGSVLFLVLCLEIPKLRLMGDPLVTAVLGPHLQVIINGCGIALLMQQEKKWMLKLDIEINSSLPPPQ